MSFLGNLRDCFLLTVNIDRALASEKWLSPQWLVKASRELRLPMKSCNSEALNLLSIDQFMVEIVQQMKAEGRSRLLIAGADTETHVTFLALRGLAEGFDVFLLSDLIATRDRRFESLFQMRLFQAGVVPTTMVQVLEEWGAAETDPTIAERIRSLQVAYRSHQ